MINYADYEFYEQTYKGTLSESLFNSLIPKASREIDKVVNRDIKEADLSNTENNFGDKIKFATCEFVDYLNKVNNSVNGGKASSISIDGVSKTTNNYTSEELIQDKKNIINDLPHDLTRFL